MLAEIWKVKAMLMRSQREMRNILEIGLSQVVNLGSISQVLSLPASRVHKTWACGCLHVSRNAPEILRAQAENGQGGGAT